jgi:lipoate-protein ligase A
MAVDHSLLRAAQEGVAFLRLYRWSPACLSFGRNEPAGRRYDRDAIARLNLDTVRRPTGGRAVWHDVELTYAVAAPCRVFGTLRDSYLTIHRMLAGALRRLGAPVELAAPPSGRALRPSAGACFAAPVGGELLVGDGKLVGSAQVRERTALLQHGSILLENGQDMVTRVSRNVPGFPRATSLADVLGSTSHAGFEDVAAVIAEEAQRSWVGQWQVERNIAIADCGRYADPAWTWRV